MVRGVPEAVMDIFMLRLTPLIVEPGGMFPVMSKASTPRRIWLKAFSPAKK
jgi:hypothetical protein